MKRPHLVLTLAILLIPALAVDTARADTLKNHFASIMLGSKKIGQVHYTARHDNEGTLQELKTRSSVSFLGVEVYHHTLHTHEFWKADEMKRLWGSTNEHGTTYEIDLSRKSAGYAGTLNNQLIELPANSFPTAVWHYAITEHTQLFSIPELRLLNVKVKKSPDTVLIGNKKVPAEKFVFSGDWTTTIWFDKNKQFLKWQYFVKGKKVIVLLDTLDAA
ncbi:MAG TPA: hypothetical protein DDW55_11385 [Gammaproteobacteria bacterium]|nr:hypothetical protein [Gammaproteobacteria bacterium]